MRVVFLCLLVLVLASCSTPSQSQTAITGTDGVVLTPVYVPSSVFEGEDFSITYRLENRGSVPITQDNPGSLIVNVDPLYLSFIDSSSRFPNQYFWLSPRTRFSQGESAFVNLHLRANSIDRFSQEIRTRILTTVCYPYESIITSEVCIERDRQTDPGSVVCRAGPVSPASVGSPLVVNSVQTRTGRVGEGSDARLVPQFRIELVNRGSGIPSAGTCDSQGGLNSALVQVSVLNELLDCQGMTDPDFDGFGEVRFINNRASLSCTIPIFSSSLFPATQGNFLSLVTVHMKYSYRESDQSEVRIVR